MIQAAADVAAARGADDDGDRRAAAVAIPQRSRLIDDLIERARDEIRELHLGNWPVTANGRADADPNDRRFGDWRIEHAQLAELLVQALRSAERSSVRADVLSKDEHLRVAPHLFGKRLADRFEVRKLFRHQR